MNFGGFPLDVATFKQKGSHASVWAVIPSQDMHPIRMPHVPHGTEGHQLCSQQRPELHTWPQGLCAGADLALGAHLHAALPSSTGASVCCSVPPWNGEFDANAAPWEQMGLRWP